ncbi:SPOR domain-containing protein [Antarcticimicrobium luteum]|uniref:SPOR domain-containing protein n=1 Tax=Antarcticimicrobium luteum TaxID=2547397 RepID=A0A4R5VHS6_9RHOB|nr:SPOR domain-containing protein [Antarcticimicrobium luteum]TDK51958.1 SPOR domain-containing protein [Antarcticimicrobium luteum]
MAKIEYTYGVYGDELYADDAAAQPGMDPARAQGATLSQGSFGRAMNVAGALASLALVVGVGVWGYKLMMRDVSGVPVVRALVGPMRVLPEDPGGRPADHQGLAVNAVAAEGTAAAPPDRLALAPRPVELADEDAPMGVLGAAMAVSADAGSLDRRADTQPGTPPDAQVAALVEELTRGVEPLSGAGRAPAAPEQDRIVQPVPLSGGSPSATGDTAQDETEITAATVRPAVLNGPGLRRSLRPHVRPARFDSAAAMGADVAAALSAAQDAVASLDVAPDTVPDGARLAQLGAFDTPELARAEWDRLANRFGEYLDGKQRVIQQASSGGRTFYRLRAIGFEDLSDARRFCSALVAENADCIPVTAR